MPLTSPEALARRAVKRATAEGRARNLMHNTQYRLTPKGRAQHLWLIVRRRARKAGMCVEIDLAWILERLERGHCEVTGLPFRLEPPSRTGRNPHAPSVDRKDNDVGYTKENCQLVVLIHNMARNVWGDAPLLEYAARILASLGHNRGGSSSMSHLSWRRPRTKP